jgi:hypothetical protein
LAPKGRRLQHDGHCYIRLTRGLTGSACSPRPFGETRGSVRERWFALRVGA